MLATRCWSSTPLFVLVIQHPLCLCVFWLFDGVVHTVVSVEGI